MGLQRLHLGVAPVIILVVELKVVSGGVHIVEHGVQSPAEGGCEEDQGQDTKPPLRSTLSQEGRKGAEEDLGVDIVELSRQDQHSRQDALDCPSEVSSPVNVFAEREDKLWSDEKKGSEGGVR